MSVIVKSWDKEKGAAIIINEQPKEVARREQSKEGMMDGWYGFLAQGVHNNGERKKKKKIGVIIS
jgi:hypothetical protein